MASAVRIAMFRGAPAISNLHFTGVKLLPGMCKVVADAEAELVDSREDLKGCIEVVETGFSEDDIGMDYIPPESEEAAESEDG